MHTQVTNVQIAFENRRYKYYEIDIQPPFTVRILISPASIYDWPEVLPPLSLQIRPNASTVIARQLQVPPQWLPTE
jgi:hypothetical protein